MIIGIDIDNTVLKTYETANYYVNKYGESYSDNIKIKDYEHFKSLKLVGFYQDYLEKIQKEVKPFPGAVKALNVLKDKGFKLIFITARGSNFEHIIDYDYEDTTKTVFDKYQIPYDKIIYRCYPKGERAKLENVDLFIDDKEYNLDDLTKHGVKSIKVVHDMNEESKYKKFDNWNDILKYILEMRENK